MSNDLDILTRTIYGEAEEGNRKDAEAIACVIMNRVASKDWPNSANDVCLQPWQFSCWNTGNPARDKIMNASGAWLKKCKEIASKALTGQLKDPTFGSTHYYENDDVVPEWARKRIAVFQIKQNSGIKRMFFNNIAPSKETCADIPKEDKPEKTPITKSKSMKVAVGAGLITVLGEIIANLAPAFGFAGKMLEYAPYFTIGIFLIAIGFMLWDYYINRNKG